MATVNVTPAGNKLFQVEIHDETGDSTHEVGVPDGFPARVGVEDAALQDVVLAAVRYLLERRDRDQLENRFSLQDVAESYPDFTESVSRRVKDIATGMTPPTDMHVADEERVDADERLVEQVREEQEAGQATPGQRRL